MNKDDKLTPEDKTHFWKNRCKTFLIDLVNVISITLFYEEVITENRFQECDKSFASLIEFTAKFICISLAIAVILLLSIGTLALTTIIAIGTFKWLWPVWLLLTAICGFRWLYVTKKLNEQERNDSNMIEEWKLIDDAATRIEAVTQTHEKMEVKAVELVRQPRTDRDVTWNYALKLTFDNMTVNIEGLDQTSSFTAKALKLDVTTYSYGPVDYLTISSNGLDILVRD